MSEPRRADPRQGVTLQAMIEHLVDRYGWEGLGTRINIRCFTHDPSVASSLKFLRKTPWARAKVESLYLHSAAHPRKSAPQVPVSDSPPGWWSPQRECRRQRLRLRLLPDSVPAMAPDHSRATLSAVPLRGKAVAA